MIPSPLLLDRYVVTEFSFNALADYNYPSENDGKVELADLKIEVIPHKHKDDPLRWIFSLTVELPEGAERRYPYSFKAVLVGFFDISPSYPSERVELLANVNAPALLYSAAREFIASVTGRGPYMAVWLPSVAFVKLPQAAPEKPRKAIAKSSRSATKKAKK